MVAFIEEFHSRGKLGDWIDFTYTLFHQYSISYNYTSSPNSTSPVKIISISGRRKNKVRNVSSTSPEPIGTIELSPSHPLISPQHPSSSSSASFSPPPPSITAVPTTTTTTSFIANSYSSTAVEPKDTLTGQAESPDHKQLQAKKLFGVIRPTGSSRDGTPNISKRGLSLDDLLDDQERRGQRLSNHTSTSSTPKNSPRMMKQHKIKLNGHSRNGEWKILLVWPLEVEPWFHSWCRGRVETLDAKYNLLFR